MVFEGLKDVLNTFDDIGWKGVAGFGDWEIANGGYDLWFELSYQDEVVARCVDGELSFGRLDVNVKKELCGQIQEVYDHLRIEPEEQRKMLEDSFEVGQEFFEKETGRYFTLTGEGGRSFNIWNIEVFDFNKAFLHRTSVHAGRLANDILTGDIVPAAEVQKGLDENERSSDEEPLVDIYDLAFVDEGYLHFTVEVDGYSLEGLFRVYDPANGPDLSLVSIDFGDRHPIIARQWDRIEMMLAEASLDRYNEIDEVIEIKERVLKAMEAADYFYDEINSSDFNHRFNGDYGTSMSFDNFTEVAEWLDGVVFEDPNVSDAVEKIMHPERFEELKGLDDVIKSCEDLSRNTDKCVAERDFWER